MPVATSTHLQLPLSDAQLSEINDHLSTLEPQQILSWALDHLPNLYQTTAFGLTGLAITDMLSKLSPNPPPLVFIDTLYHFKETLDLKDEVERKYGVPIHVVKPWGFENAAELEDMYGERLWEKDEDTYDLLVKVEPAQRAYRSLNAQSVITGRRASQGAARAALKPLEVDSTGLLKLNPLSTWNFAQVKAYIDENQVPANVLLSQGYKSVGDWHSTFPSGEGDLGEREGRWKGREKTECGLHKDYFRLKRQAQKQQREEGLRLKDLAKGEDKSLEVPPVEEVWSGAQ